MSELDVIQDSMKSSKVKTALKVIGVLILFVLVYLGSAVATGFISAFSNNIETSTFNIIFDSQITIAYLLMYYSLSHFNKFSENQNYVLFVVALLLSFTTNFIQGALTLLILPPLLKKLKLIQTS
jgi:hypothetical protein